MRKRLNAYPVWDTVRCTSSPLCFTNFSSSVLKILSVFFFLGVLKECLTCSHVAWGFSHLILALSSAGGAPRHTASGPTAGSTWCLSHLVDTLVSSVRITVQNHCLHGVPSPPHQHLSLWFPDSASSCWAPRSPPRFFPGAKAVALWMGEE